MNIDELKVEAEELGIKVDGRWSAAKIQEMIDTELNKPGDETEVVDPVAPEDDSAEVVEERTSEVTVKNIGKNLLAIGPFAIAVGEVKVFPPELLKNENLAARFKTAVRCNKLEEV